MEQSFSPGGFQRTAESEKKKAAAALAAKGKLNNDPSRHALVKPNSISSWFHTNGYDCKHKTNGTCNYSHLHGVCGFARPDGALCTGKHLATEHTDTTAVWNK